jgi:glucose-6-phosphate 1-dehydrogenase
MKTRIIIFGITGDLSQRKLLPALSDIVRTGEYDNLSIIGVSRREVRPIDVVGSNGELIDRTTVFTMNVADVGDYRRLSDFLQLETNEQALMYLSVPPSAAVDIVDFLGQAGLNTPNVKILLEKPFGFDQASAQDFLERTSRYFQEDQLYRIDHYMAKEVTQYILKLRLDAENHHHSWDSRTVAAIDVVASEKIGIEDRRNFYEETGALRDFIQGHLMQMLALVLMEVTEDFDLDNLAAYRLKALEKLQPADPTRARRAQYEGYQAEVENEGSLTETFASLELQSNDERWQGVSLRLTTGKKLAEKRSYIQVTYRDGTSDTFEEGKTPIEGRLKDAYERVIIDAMNSSKGIFTTGPEVLQSWKIVAPVQQAWEFNGEPLPLYSPGVVVDDLLSQVVQ